MKKRRISRDSDHRIDHHTSCLRFFKKNIAQKHFKLTFNIKAKTRNSSFSTEDKQAYLHVLKENRHFLFLLQITRYFPCYIYIVQVSRQQCGQYVIALALLCCLLGTLPCAVCPSTIHFVLIFKELYLSTTVYFSKHSPANIFI